MTFNKWQTIKLPLVFYIIDKIAEKRSKILLVNKLKIDK